MNERARSIAVMYTAIDGYRDRRNFKTLKGAQNYAQKYVGKHPDISESFGYAVSNDGIGKIMVRGAALRELFPPPSEAKTDAESEPQGRAPWE